MLEQCLAHVQQPRAVPLPEACRAPRATSLRELNHLVERGATRAARLFRSPTARLVAAAIALSILVAAIGGIMNDEHPADNSSKGQVVEQPAASTGDPSATSLWYDGVAEELVELHADLEPLKTRAARSWDDGATSPSATSPTPIPTLSHNP